MHLRNCTILLAERFHAFFASTIRDIREEDARVGVVLAVRIFRYWFVVIGLRGEIM